MKGKKTNKVPKSPKKQTIPAPGKKSTKKPPKNKSLPDSKATTGGKDRPTDNKPKVGRPTDYSLDLAKRICAAYVSCKDGIEKVCAENQGFPHAATIYEWRNTHKEFDEMYTRAREAKAEFVAGLMIDVAFDEKGDEIPFYGQVHVQRDKIKMDALKWQASKLDARKYGDKVDLTSLGDRLPAAQPIVLTPELTKSINKDLESDL